MSILLLIVAILIGLGESAKDSCDAARFHNSNTLEQKYPHTWGRK